MPQLKAELGEACIVIQDIGRLSQQLEQAYVLLRQSRPVVLAFHPDILCKPAQIHFSPPGIDAASSDVASEAKKLLTVVTHQSRKGRIIIFVGAEAALATGIRELTTELSERLKAPTVWSVNGANAVSPSNRFGYGYISFGGNDRALDLWEGLSSEDTVIALGFDPEEYVLNLQTLSLKQFCLLTEQQEPYGAIDGSFGHRMTGECILIRGKIDQLLRECLRQLPSLEPKETYHPAPKRLNRRNFPRDVAKGCVDLVAFYERVDQLWQPPSVGFDDVCMSYKDRQYICQRPNPNIRFYAATGGSAMGGAYGMAIGAKLADRNLNVFVFSGDGCFRLFGAALSEVANLGLRLFILNNGSYAIVEQGLKFILPDVEPPRYHADLPAIDFVKMAEAQGWIAHRLATDLSNLDEIMKLCNSNTKQSILVEVPVDKDQDIGVNPRVRNLTLTSYL